MSIRIIIGDCRERLRELPDKSVQCCVTSPPYFGLRDYGHDGQMGLENTPDEYVSGMVGLFREVRRVLRDDGTLWLNLGDSYAAGRSGTTMPAETLAGGLNGQGDDASRRGRLAQVPDNKNPKTSIAQYQPHRNATAIGLKHKDLIGIPWRVAFALQADGWWLRQDIIWAKPNPMPESVKDRCTKAHEYIFMLSKSARYFYDAGAIAEDALYSGAHGQDASGYKDAQLYNGKHQKPDKQRGHGRRHAGFNDRWDAMTKAEQCSGTRNKRSVWTVATQPFSEAHFATFPPALIEPCILAGCPESGTVLDPFGGAGTTGLVADRLGRDAILIELNPDYTSIAQRRVENDAGMFAEVSVA